MVCGGRPETCSSNSFVDAVGISISFKLTVALPNLITQDSQPIPVEFRVPRNYGHILSIGMEMQREI